MENIAYCCLGGSRSSHSNVLHADGGLDTHTFLGQEVHQQRAGTAVTLGVQTGLAVLVLLHTVQVDVEEVGRVEGTALGLGVELSAEDRARLVDHAWDSVSKDYYTYEYSNTNPRCSGRSS